MNMEIDILKGLILNTNGKVFYVRFTKQNGDEREMQARLGVSKFVTGKGLSYDPENRGNMIVCDMAQTKDVTDKRRPYRTIKLESVLEFRCGEDTWHA